MGRPLRIDVGGLVYHVLNRGNARMTIFDKPEDYDAFERILEEAVDRIKMRVLAWAIMPSHWHMVCWTRADGDLSRFIGWLSLTHTQRWHAHRHSVGTGHVYQGRFKSFVVESDEHLWTVCRYVERNPLRADLCRCAEDWRWSSLWRMVHGDESARALVAAWPVARPADWTRRVNRAETEKELESLRRSTNRGQPFGRPDWVERTVKRFGLESTLRPRGRPRQMDNGS
jgi:putative transposase